MNDYFKWFYNILVQNNVSEEVATYLNLVVNSIILIIALLLIDYVLKRIIIKTFGVFTIKTKTTYDDFLVKSKFPKYIAHIIPFIILRKLIPFVLADFEVWKTFFTKATDVYLIILMVWIIRSLLNTTKNYLKQKEHFKDKPLDSYAQVIIIFSWFVGAIFIFSELTGKSLTNFFVTFGAASAILLLIFRDTILGFVASIQVSINDMVRIGDWITMEKYGADGDVIEINLATVKVSNWDLTITTIPTYALISDSFRNWRGMQESGGRRIKRAFILKTNSIKFLSPDDLKKFSKIQILADYITHRQKDIDKYNKEHNYDKSFIVNGRNQTNLGLFRKYCDLYLSNHAVINKEMMIMTRHLEPTSKGIPLEIYTFSRDKRWENYEHIMADIFEHLIAAVPHFDLELFQEPSSKDINELSTKLK
ncbi:mechanosensitive ion channel [Aureibaculum sp. 2210JD6-5]|uniref:mechanosensitive ion channel family protein n=1 Tax=Aureibaculum sp. 2210JD6-5 TaxID=3103957 RepID=UPI002AACED18|nr:mechanosensitive ion channel domain-containing protein [Aureibaculum sp. 2210JD6-5]MDY7395031.1 mechanosensitive ion channel [Aureibaculum sp. 2210JD6-5]